MLLNALKVHLPPHTCLAARTECVCVCIYIYIYTLTNCDTVIIGFNMIVVELLVRIGIHLYDIAMLLCDMT